MGDKKNKKSSAISDLIDKDAMPFNNEIFSALATNKDFCQELLRVLLSDNELVVLENEPQKHFPNAYFKSSIIDLLCELKDGRVVNVEIQLYKKENHAKRIFYYASMIRRAYSKKGIDYDKFNDIIIIYLTKEDIFGEGSTIYNVDMNIVSDQNKVVKRWDCGLKVLYINTEGLTNKNINEYLKLLTDHITYAKEYKATSKAKKELFMIGGNKTMSAKWLLKMFKDYEKKGMEQGKTEERKNLLLELFGKGLITKEQAEELSNGTLVV